MQKSVLIIDDEPISIRVMKNLIGERYKINAVTDGSAAMRYLSKYKPDAILLDVLMPIYDGTHLLEMIRSNSDNLDIPVVVVTGVTDDEKLEDIQAQGVKHIVRKPISKEKLLEALSAVLDVDEE